MKSKVKACLVASAVAVVLGCAQTQVQHTAATPPAEVASIMQVGYGPNARYVTCPVSSCARPTQKTIALPDEATSATAPAAPAPANAIAPSPTNLMAAQAAVQAMMPSPALLLRDEPTSAGAPASVASAPRESAKPAAPVITAAASAAPAATPQPAGRVYIRFPEGSARLDAQARQQLDELAPLVKNAEQIVIRGRTDQRGDNDSNDRLAMRRALAVYDHLKRSAKAGEKPFKLLAKGACCYVASNDTPEGRAENRRAEIDFVTPMQASATTTTRRTPRKAHSS